MCYIHGGMSDMPKSIKTVAESLGAALRGVKYESCPRLRMCAIMPSIEFDAGCLSVLHGYPTKTFLSSWSLLPRMLFTQKKYRSEALVTIPHPFNGIGGSSKARDCATRMCEDDLAAISWRGIAPAKRTIPVQDLALG